jgi:outer membrane protein OmpA-like peptidoglycan-associated protein
MEINPTNRTGCAARCFKYHFHWNRPKLLALQGACLHFERAVVGDALRIVYCTTNRISALGSAVAIAILLLSVRAPNAALESDVLRQHQTERDSLFKTLQATATDYTFKYVVIYLPAGTVPGKNFPIPVSHVRYDSTVLFAFNSYALEAGADHILNDLARVAIKDENFRSLLVVGHTDSIGTDDYNVVLSKKRAFTVAGKLQAFGVNGKYVGVIPMGKAQPIATNRSPEGQALNRRVEFFISDIPEATEKAVELVPFNPCFRNDQNSVGDTPITECDKTLKRVPVYTADSDSRPRRLLVLRGTPTERSKLPDVSRTRPSIQELNAQ